MSKMNLSGYLYIAGFIGALLVGLLEGLDLMPSYTWVPWVLILAGLLIGFFNIVEGESQSVMIAALVLGGATGVLTLLPAIGGLLDAVLSRIAFISLPVAIPVAVKTLATKGR